MCKCCLRMHMPDAVARKNVHRLQYIHIVHVIYL